MNPLQPAISIRLFRHDKCYGRGIDALLRGVEEYHSLRAAAKAMGMAYSKAWTVVRTCEQELGFPLLHSNVGGRNGGGATPTAEARALMAAYERYCRRLQEQAEQLFQEEFREFL